MRIKAALALGWFWAVDVKGDDVVDVLNLPRKPRPMIEFEKPKDLPQKEPVLDVKVESDAVVFTR